VRDFTYAVKGQAGFPTRDSWLLESLMKSQRHSPSIPPARGVTNGTCLQRGQERDLGTPLQLLRTGNFVDLSLQN
jgi:hypothetical protein